MQRVALITGCSSGIGRATAVALLDEEWSVVATARDESTLAGLADRGCRTASLDVTDDAAVTAVVEETIDAFGRIDCLVNNAGFSQVGPIEDVPVERVQEQFDVNVFGPHRLTRAVLPHMRERGDGTIVNVSSGLGRVSLPGIGVYSGSKFAMEAMSDALRGEVNSLGVDVVLVEPGHVNTGFHDRADGELTGLGRSDAYDGVYTLLDDWLAIGGFGPSTLGPAEVADVIVNAASATQPRARYTVGTTGRLAALGSLLPHRVRDAAYRLALKAATWRADR